MYALGKGQPQNHIQAYILMKKAISLGENRAKKALNWLKSKMTQEQLNEAERLIRDQSQ